MRAESRKKIGEVAQQLGVTVRALRFYEEEGLITAQRTPRGTRYYSDEDVTRFRGIIRLAESGVPLSLVKKLIKVRTRHDTGAKSSRGVEKIIDELTLRVKSQITTLNRLVSDLSGATETLQHCHACENPPTRAGCPRCPINVLTGTNELLNLIWEQHACEEQEAASR